MKNTKTPPKTSPSVSTRLPADARARLIDEASKRGLSISDFVRAILLERLDDESELSRLRMKVSTLESSLLGLREDLAVAVKALLVTAGSGQSVTPEEAEAWVEANMKAVG